MNMFAWRLIRTRSLLLLATLSVSCPAGPIYAQEPQDDQRQVYGDWTVRCEPREDTPPCDMVQVVSRKDTRQPLMVFSVGHAGRQEQYGVRIGVPLDVMVSGGVVVRIDGKEELPNFKFTRCVTTGCQIEAMLESDTLRPLRQGESGFLAILNAQGKPLIFPVSLKGFSAAVDAVAEKNRAWAKSQR